MALFEPSRRRKVKTLGYPDMRQFSEFLKKLKFQARPHFGFYLTPDEAVNIVQDIQSIMKVAIKQAHAFQSPDWLLPRVIVDALSILERDSKAIFNVAEASSGPWFTIMSWLSYPFRGWHRHNPEGQLVARFHAFSSWPECIKQVTAHYVAAKQLHGTVNKLRSRIQDLVAVLEREVAQWESTCLIEKTQFGGLRVTTSTETDRSVRMYCLHGRENEYNKTVQMRDQISMVESTTSTSAALLTRLYFVFKDFESRLSNEIRMSNKHYLVNTCRPEREIHAIIAHLASTIQDLKVARDASE